MRFSPKIQKAIVVSSLCHSGTYRKVGNQPYISHPFAVALIVSEYTDKEEAICAALLHDVVEETRFSKKPCTFQDIEKNFGKKTTNIVQDLTEEEDKRNKKSGWKNRKEKYIKTIQNTKNTESLLVCCADKIHNILSMIEAYKEYGDAMWDSFNNPPERKLWFYEEILHILKKRLHSPIVGELELVYKKARALFGKVEKEK